LGLTSESPQLAPIGLSAAGGGEIPFNNFPNYPTTASCVISVIWRTFAVRAGRIEPEKSHPASAASNKWLLNGLEKTVLTYQSD